uniref:Uncharacterized protein n=1 Tax=Caenorhabditis tropicalis TaxID=1561998 RepID=A0A1I7U5B7_9PELO
MEIAQRGGCHQRRVTFSSSDEESTGPEYYPSKQNCLNEYFGWSACITSEQQKKSVEDHYQQLYNDIYKIGKDMVKIRENNRRVIAKNESLSRELDILRKELHNSSGLLYLAKDFVVGSWEYTYAKCQLVCEYIPFHWFP